MGIQTVTGVLDDSELGLILPHEHILADFRVLWVPSDDPKLAWLESSRVSPEIMADLSHHGLVCKDNLVLGDLTLATKELLSFKMAGGGTVVDMTNRGMAPRPRTLRRISRLTGVNVVAGCGFYLSSSHPANMDEMPVDHLAELITNDITEGIDGSGVRAGIIGELGTSYPMTKNEAKVLLAAAQAQKVTGVSVNLHVAWPGKIAKKLVRTLESNGVDPSRVILSHMDHVQSMSFGLHKDLAETGAYVEFDCFGQEDYMDERNRVHPRDLERIAEIGRLVDAGFTKSVLMSHDTAFKMHLHRFGGHGYDHLLLRVVPMLKRWGITETEITQMMVLNPRRAICC